MTDDANLVDAIIRGNLAAYREGKRQAVKEVVAWHREKNLRNRKHHTLKAIWHGLCADAIEAGEHVNETLKEDA